jgi:hypothetical protein
VSAWSTGKTAAFVLAALCAASPAEAQTWVGKRTRPHLGEIFALDKTGETGWLYGEEDLAGDGLGTFKQPEQSVDIRTAYAANDGARFWTRVYFSDPATVAANIKVFVFIDADQNDTTGGSAVATDIDPKLAQDTPATGFEYVIELHSDGTVAQIWTWQQAMGKFAATVPQPMQVAGEVGKDRDPIRLNGLEHGYVQGAVDFGLIGLTSVCNANLYVRSVNTAQNGPSDLDVGFVVPCEPADANKDGVPDIVISPGGCTVDTDCAGDGYCDNSVCIIAAGCAVDTDCSADTQCSVDIGVCVIRPGGSCSVSADCGDLVCDNGGCVACAFGGDQCGADRRCSLGGLCVEGTVTSVGVGGSVGAGGSVTAGVGAGAGAGSGSSGGGPNVQGGACSCGLAGASGRGSLAALLLSLSLPLGGLFRRRRRSPRSSGGQQG